MAELGGGICSSMPMFTLYSDCYGTHSKLKHFRNVGTRLHGPQAFLSLTSQCGDDVSDFK